MIAGNLDRLPNLVINVSTRHEACSLMERLLRRSEKGSTHLRDALARHANNLNTIKASDTPQMLQVL